MIADQLQPGDTLLYRGKGVFGWVIGLKTWSDIAHCEIYVGDGLSVASRDGIGVGRYPLRTSELLYVLRPTDPFDLAAALETFDREWRGQGYDWLGLVRFAWRAPVRTTKFNNKQFCSELWTRVYRAGGFHPMARHVDADSVAPANIFILPAFERFDVAESGAVTPWSEALV